MELETIVEGSWLEKVHDIIMWSVVAPRIHTPFGCGVPTPLLRKFVQDPEALKRHIGLRGMVDGHECILITNMRTLNFFSDHFIVSKMNKNEVDDYLSTYGIYEWLDEQLGELQQEYAQELARRSKERRVERAPEESSKAKRKRKQGEKEEAREGQFNRFYSGGSKK